MYRAPITTSTSEAVRLSRGGLEQEVDEAIEMGTYGFKGGWISSLAFNTLIKSRGEERKIPLNLRKEILKDMGYIPHPGLKGGRVNNIIQPDDGKPILYIQPDNPAVTLTVAPDIVKAYQKAQEG